MKLFERKSRFRFFYDAEGDVDYFLDQYEQWFRQDKQNGGYYYVEDYDLREKLDNALGEYDLAVRELSNG